MTTYLVTFFLIIKDPDGMLDTLFRSREFLKRDKAVEFVEKAENSTSVIYKKTKLDSLKWVKK